MLSLSPNAKSVLACWAIVLACGALQPCLALTPESPEVKAAVAKGVAFLTAEGPKDDRTGAQALAGLTVYKVLEKTDHPVVKAAVTKIRRELSEKGDFDGNEQIYHLGLSLVFLCTADPVAFRKDIDAVMTRLFNKQKAHGGWGYPEAQTGDTSMTQYGVLGMWEASRAGIHPPMQNWERVCNWLIRTQDPGGAFGYQGHDPGNFTPVPQQEIRPSMAAAGLGSLYVCADQFGISDQKDDTDKTKPSALKEVKKPAAGREKQRPAGVDVARLRAAMQRGNAWFGKNFTDNPDDWPHYYYYAYERYESFHEQVDRINNKEPAWYNSIGARLLKDQQAAGSWGGSAGPVPDTAFAVLFLIRGTKKAIQQSLGAGTLVGGRGLPSDAAKLELRQGSVVRKPLSGPADQLLSVMEDPSNPEFLAAVEGLADAKLEADDAQLNQNLVRLKKLAAGNSPQAKAVALRLLARSRSLDNVPLLIFALRDPDFGVIKEARDGLRFISRKFEAFGPEIPEGTYDIDQFEKERRTAIEAWKNWYLSVRPDHVFED